MNCQEHSVIFGNFREYYCIFGNISKLKEILGGIENFEEINVRKFAGILGAVWKFSRISISFIREFRNFRNIR